ncbi:hypothetical protein [Nocardia flavorosea]|uniref:hypothetical protein n=1 Tax=Nocardia flavorosea TaxID=53429 RepID=UPI000B1D32B4|nr:hypothetical protein [Nocardia flavorosea]
MHIADRGQPVRVAEFDRFFADAVRDMRRPGRQRLKRVFAADAEPVARDLAARESGCCSFFTFDFDTGAEGSLMTVSVPSAYTEVLDALAARVRVAIGSAQSAGCGPAHSQPRPG